MSTLSQLPGVLDIFVTQGDELNVPITLYLDVTGFRWESYVYQLYDSTGGGGVPLFRARYDVFQPTVGVINATSGSLVIGFSETQTSAMSPALDYRWYLRWIATGQITRTIVSGSITVSFP